MEKMVSESHKTRRGHGKGGGTVALEHVVAGGPSGTNIPAEGRARAEEGRGWYVGNAPFPLPCSPSPHTSDFHTSLPEGGGVGTRAALCTQPCWLSPFKGQPSRRASTPGLCEPGSSQGLWAFYSWSGVSITDSPALLILR